MAKRKHYSALVGTTSNDGDTIYIGYLGSEFDEINPVVAAFENCSEEFEDMAASLARARTKAIRFIHKCGDYLWT
jgi:hypothetical protein